MQQELISYIKIYKQAIDTSACEKAIKELEARNEWRPHLFYNNASNLYYDNKDEPEFCMSAISDSAYLNDVVWNCISNYISNYSFPWFDSWSDFSDLKYLKYNSDNTMATHCDHIHTLFDGSRKGVPILTVIGQLNEDFKGGELLLCESTEVLLKRGDVIIFPSNFLYPHSIKKLIHGTRYSFASWVW